MTGKLQISQVMAAAGMEPPKYPQLLSGIQYWVERDGGGGAH